MFGLLLVAAVVTRPISGLQSRGGRSDALTARVVPLFPAGQVPGPGIDREDAGRTREVLSAFVSTPETVRIDQICNINGSRTDLYYHVTEPGLETFALEQPPSRAAVIVVPGGGNSYVAWDKEGTFVAKWLNSLGISAFVLKYRVPSNENTHISFMDLERAMSTVRSKAQELDIDAERIGAIGFSAGGRITSSVSDTADTLGRLYSRMDEIDDVPFKPNFQMLIYPSVAPFLNPGEKPPPTFVAHAQDDPCCPPPFADLYCKAVKSAGQSCKDVLYRNGGHGIGVCTGRWKEGVPHTVASRGWNGADGWYNTWSGDDFCDWMGEAKTWLEEIGIIKH